MALTISMALGSTPQVVVGQPTNFIIGIKNNGSASVVLSSLSVVETSHNATVSQPTYLTPNVAPGIGNPTLAAGETYHYPFQAVFQAPYSPGPSPQNQPGGVVPAQAAFPANANFTLRATAQTSDGDVFSTSVLVPALSAIAPFPLAQGGALQLSQGANLVNLLTLGA